MAYGATSMTQEISGSVSEDWKHINGEWQVEVRPLSEGQQEAAASAPEPDTVVVRKPSTSDAVGVFEVQDLQTAAINWFHESRAYFRSKGFEVCGYDQANTGNEGAIITLHVERRK